MQRRGCSRSRRPGPPVRRRPGRPASRSTQEPFRSWAPATTVRSFSRTQPPVPDRTSCGRGTGPAPTGTRTEARVHAFDRDLARRDPEVLAAVVDDRVDHAAGGLERPHRRILGQAGDRRLRPGVAPVMGRPQLRAVRPAILGVREADGGDARAGLVDRAPPDRRLRRGDRRPGRATVGRVDDRRDSGRRRTGRCRAPSRP